MNDDALLIAQLQDRIRQAEDRYMITNGPFLDTHQRKLASDHFRKGRRQVRILFYGGYKEAERCMPVFLPDYAQEEDACDLLRVIRVRIPKGGRTLSHRDYLGSLLALGISRETTGDILVRQDSSPLGPGADIIVAAEMADFIHMNYTKAARSSLTTEVLPIGQLHIDPAETVQMHDTVASLRLDNIVASGFRMSRAKAAEAIHKGTVSVNSMEALKVDQEVCEGDRIVLRGKGRVILDEIGCATRKDRIRVCFQVFR